MNKIKEELKVKEAMKEAQAKKRGRYWTIHVSRFFNIGPFFI